MNKPRTAKSLKKPPPIVKNTPTPESNANEVAFEQELYWCVQQLEQALSTGKLSQRVAEDTAKNLKTLKSNSAPLIKKRQIMKLALGDYRSKMKEEEKRMSLSAKQIKFTNSTDTKSSFVKKAAILNSGKDFRFNFNTNIQSEQQQQPTGSSDNTEPKSNSSEFISKDLNLTSGKGFRFNFAVDESENLSFNELSIKNGN